MAIMDTRFRHRAFALAFRALALAPLAVVATFAPPMAAPAAALSLYEQPTYAAFMIDAESGEVLYSRQADTQRPPASITKVMTLYLAFERLAAGTMKLDDRVVMSTNAARQVPSKLGVPAGQTITVRDAIQALAIKSANDVAVALAEHMSGSEARFAGLMTKRARDLGMQNTTFANASGLTHPSHLSTARDIAILSGAVIRDFPQYYHYFHQPEFTYGKQTMRSHNHLLRTMPGVDGIKTGFTNAAGFTLAASAVRDGRRLIAVVLGAPARLSRDNNMESLLQAGFTVLDARRRGESIQVADMLAEPGDLNDFIFQTLVEQGSGDPAPAAPQTKRGRR